MLSEYFFCGNGRLHTGFSQHFIFSHSIEMSNLSLKVHQFIGLNYKSDIISLIFSLIDLYVKTNQLGMVFNEII